VIVLSALRCIFVFKIVCHEQHDLQPGYTCATQIIVYELHVWASPSSWFSMTDHFVETTVTLSAAECALQAKALSKNWQRERFTPRPSSVIAQWSSPATSATDTWSKRWSTKIETSLKNMKPSDSWIFETEIQGLQICRLCRNVFRISPQARSSKFLGSNLEKFYAFSPVFMLFPFTKIQQTAIRLSCRSIARSFRWSTQCLETIDSQTSTPRRDWNSQERVTRRVARSRHW